MTTKGMYSVYDIKSKSYAPPFLELTDGTAIRAISDIIANNPSHPFARYSEDFRLVRIGFFEEESAKVDNDKFGEVIKLDQLTGE